MMHGQRNIKLCDAKQVYHYNIQCITLVIFYGQFMMHGQRNIK